MQDITEIVKDAVKYPFLDWKKILILGLIILFSSISGIFALINTTNTVLIYFLAIIGFLIGFLVNGYKFRIILSSLNHVDELPKFNAWIDLFKSGIKVYIIIIIYLIPAILILLTFSSLSITSILGNIGSGSSGFISSIFSEATGIEVTIAKLYVTLITPLSAIAIANMVCNGGKLDAGFRFREILSHMSRIGWEKLIVWYITILALYYIFYYIGTIIFGAIEITFRFFGIVIFHMTLLLTLLIIIPYLIMFFYRSVVLIYMSGSRRYLECEKCGGYYELQKGESPEDFENCRCGGNLKYYKN